jgi:hypothetical protein
LHSEIHKLFKLIWNKDELPHQWKGSFIIPVHRKGDKSDCSNHQGISLLSTSYKTLSNIFLSGLIPHAGEIGNHRCAFWCNRSSTDQIFYVCQLQEKKWKYNDTVHQLFIDFKKAYDSVWREVFYSIRSEFGIPRKLVVLIKMSLKWNLQYSPYRQNLPDKFPIQNDLKQGVALSLVLFNFALEYAIRRVQEN